MRACFEFVARQKQLFIFFGENVNLLIRRFAKKKDFSPAAECILLDIFKKAFTLKALLRKKENVQ